MNNPNVVDMTGLTFGRLTVLKRVENDKQGNAMWLCQCVCGKTKKLRGGTLRQGKTKSCGCLLSEASKKRMTKLCTKHGMSATKLYRVYSSMRERCEKPSCPEYKNYGGRGITVCKEWKHDRNSFFEWALNNGYKQGLEIDRIDVNGNYEPSNCRWVTRVENCNNKRNNIFLEYKGEKHTLSEWARLTGIRKNTIYSRYYSGKKPEEILKV